MEGAGAAAATRRGQGAAAEMADARACGCHVLRGGFHNGSGLR